jgi:flagellar basal-body rod protein FlgB
VLGQNRLTCPNWHTDCSTNSERSIDRQVKSVQRYLSDVTSAVLERGLAGEAARQRVAADNLANVNTPGYRPRQVIFEDQLREAVRQQDASGNAERVERVQPATVPDGSGALRGDGNGVDLESEMVRLSESELHYAALLKLMSRKLAMIKSVATEGGRS